MYGSRAHRKSCSFSSAISMIMISSTSFFFGGTLQSATGRERRVGVLSCSCDGRVAARTVASSANLREKAATGGGVIMAGRRLIIKFREYPVF